MAMSDHWIGIRPITHGRFTLSIWKQNIKKKKKKAYVPKPFKILSKTWSNRAFGWRFKM